MVVDRIAALASDLAALGAKEAIDDDEQIDIGLSVAVTPCARAEQREGTDPLSEPGADQAQNSPTAADSDGRGHGPESGREMKQLRWWTDLQDSCPRGPGSNVCPVEVSTQELCHERIRISVPQW